MTRLALVLLFVASTLGAQRNCDLGQPKFDNPFSDRAGWVMPRAAWHVFDAGLAVAVAEALHRATRLPLRVTALVPPLASLALHVRGVLAHRFPFDRRDSGFDVAVRSASLLGTIPNPFYGAAIYTAAYASLFCYAHP